MIEHLRGRDRKLEPLGWTGPDAEWIALVCLHSGVFTRAQFCHYFDARQQSGVTDSCRALIEQRAAVETNLIAFQRRREDVPHIEQADLPGAWELRISVTAAKPACRSSCGGSYRSILCSNIRA